MSSAELKRRKSGVDGLVISDIPPPAIRGAKYALIHEPSDRTVGASYAFRKVGDAKACAAELAELGPWDLEAEELADRGPEALEIVRRHWRQQLPEPRPSKTVRDMLRAVGVVASHPEVPRAEGSPRPSDSDPQTVVIEGPVVLAIVGTRSFANPHWPHLAGAIIDNALTHLQPKLVVSGGAEGIDTLSANLARHRGFQVDEIEPAVRKWDAPGGFRERNQKVVGRSTHLLCIRCEHARSYGSGWTADEAERQGLQVFRRTIGAADEVDVNGWCFCGLASEDPLHKPWHAIHVWNAGVAARGQERRDKEFAARLENHQRRYAVRAR